MISNALLNFILFSIVIASLLLSSSAGYCEALADDSTCSAARDSRRLARRGTLSKKILGASLLRLELSVRAEDFLDGGAGLTLGRLVIVKVFAFTDKMQSGISGCAARMLNLLITFYANQVTTL